MLFLATTINYIDRQILALLKPILDDYQHWTNAQFGMVNSAFQAAYAVGRLLFLPDRVCGQSPAGAGLSRSASRPSPRRSPS
jgi:sugar phosphate permease